MMKRVMLIASLAAMVAACGDKPTPKDNTYLTDKSLPYPRGTCFAFEGHFDGARSYTFIGQLKDGHYTFIIAVPTALLKPVPCQERGDYAQVREGGE